MVVEGLLLGLISRAKQPGHARVAAALATAVICGGALAPAVLARARLSCSTLKGKRLASTPKLKVVERSSETKSVAYACVPPNGPVRIATQSSGLTTGSEYALSLVAKAGSWVALRFNNVQGVSNEQVAKAFDAANGRSYRYWRYSPNPTAKPEELRELDHVVLDAFGDVALAEHEGVTERIVAFEAKGKRHVLDSGPRAQIPPASLTLSSRRVKWVDAGMTRSAPI